MKPSIGGSGAASFPHIVLESFGNFKLKKSINGSGAVDLQIRNRLNEKGSDHTVNDFMSASTKKKNANMNQASTTMSSDLTFITNEPGKSLRDRFNVLLAEDTHFFDCLVGYFFISGFY